MIKRRKIIKPYYKTELGKLYHGDCLDIMSSLEYIDLVLTDPPYLYKNTGGGGFARKRRFYSEHHLAGLTDFDFEKYVPLFIQRYPFVIAFHNRDLISKYASLRERYSNRDLKYDLHIWHKTNAIPFVNNTWKKDIEYISLIWSKKPGWRKGLKNRVYEKTYISSVMINRVHPAQKPLLLIAKYINVLEPTLTLDPFAGSGTTGVACERLNRKYILIEKELKYCKIIKKRIIEEIDNKKEMSRRKSIIQQILG